MLEQNYEYDLVNQEALLQKYIDKNITVIDDKKNMTEGTLLAAEGNQLTLQTPKGIVMITGGNNQVTVPSLPEGLITQPTLVWLLNSKNSFANEPLEVSYQSGGLNWHAEYVVALADNDKSLDLSGWVSIENHSGTTYPDAHLKVVAGDIHRAPSGQPTPYARKMAMMNDETADQSFEERGFFEYHLYDLGRQTTIKNNEVKQISLLSVGGVSAEKFYAYRGGRNAEVSIKFKNTKENNMGMPLPEGTVRIMKRDKDGSLELAGEDHIQHTPRDEEITLKAGNAFDLLGERTVTDSKRLGDRSSQESIQITLKNRKDEDVTIDVYENLGSGWEITKSSNDYEKKSASEVVFHIPVKARTEEKMAYTVIRSW
ncbi:MAG TPA: DUF4139 domain-containing protein [Candidatus Kapabacteria bacterium]|nr:DUF4139 domain-containing protein [Candidatus Kapabacteria bacterium]